jgi:hypothetical protein
MMNKLSFNMIRYQNRSGPMLNIIKAHFHSAKTNGHKKVLVAVANGSEEIETVSIIDILRRA